MFYSTLKIHTDSRPTFHDITPEVKALTDTAQINNGTILIYSQHTTCSVLIQEQSDDINYWGTQLILQDMVNVFEKIIPTCKTEGQYLHPGPIHIEIAQRERSEEPFWSLNTDAHLRSVLLGRSVTVPLVDGELLLGEFGRIYFADFDQVRARDRIVHVLIQGE